VAFDTEVRELFTTCLAQLARHDYPIAVGVHVASDEKR
jgi:hypothetical protein